MNLLFNTLVAYKLVISFKEERWAEKPFETKDRELSIEQLPSTYLFYTDLLMMLWLQIP